MDTQEIHIPFSPLDSILSISLLSESSYSSSASPISPLFFPLPSSPLQQRAPLCRHGCGQAGPQKWSPCPECTLATRSCSLLLRLMLLRHGYQLDLAFTTEGSNQEGGRPLRRMLTSAGFSASFFLECRRW